MVSTATAHFSAVKPDTLHRSGPTLRVGELPYGSSESTTSRNDSEKPAGAFLALEQIPPLEFGCFAERRVLGLRVDPDQRQLELGALLIMREDERESRE
jgi:hypothetical protein